jgi:hypothetical protein
VIFCSSQGLNSLCKQSCATIETVLNQSCFFSDLEANDDVMSSRTDLSTEDEEISPIVQEENETSKVQVIAGISLVIFAGFSFTASNIIQKFYVPSLTFWQLLLHRAIVQVINGDR